MPKTRSSFPRARENLAWVAVVVVVLGAPLVVAVVLSLGPPNMNKCKFPQRQRYQYHVWNCLCCQRHSNDNVSSFSPICSAAEEDDEEWGWGDEDDNEDDIELTPSYNGDSNLHNRRPSNDSSGHKKMPPAALPKKSPLRPSTSITRTPANTFSDTPTLPSIQHTPAPAPVSGLSLKKATPIGRLNATIAPAPMSAGAPALGTSIGGAANNPLPSSIGGAPLQITSLGTKKPTVAQPKKAPAPPSPPEDDIFASMGLAAKPTFSHNSSSSRPVAAASGSRWNTTAAAPVTAPVNTSLGFSQSTTKPPPPVATFGGSSRFGANPSSATSNFAELKASSSGVGGDEEWGDDADLDDLLDD
jgi:hypothetical protein